ncbi:MAG: hypothetical protein KGR26_14115, partial [Cyanobacteria bacterium REEB65]|nr:hypothetical protein [Cyanobacteria bacterium REEB65]
MVSPRLVRNGLLLGTTASLIACVHRMAPVSPSPALSGGRRLAQVSETQIQPREILRQIPGSVAEPEATTQLVSIGQSQIATTFTPDAFQGQPGLYTGFAPGFSADILSRAMFYPVDDAFVPYTLTNGQYVPVSFYDESTGWYFYPMLVLRQGQLVPVYYVVANLIPTYAVAYPV